MRQIHITKAEDRIMCFLEKNIYAIILIIVSVLGWVVRHEMFYNVTSDYASYTAVWFDEIQSKGGISGLKNFDGGYGSYNYAYLMIIAILTYLPCTSLTSIKLVSVFLIICVRQRQVFWRFAYIGVLRII